MVSSIYRLLIDLILNAFHTFKSYFALICSYMPLNAFLKKNAFFTSKLQKKPISCGAYRLFTVVSGQILQIKGGVYSVFFLFPLSRHLYLLNVKKSESLRIDAYIQDLNRHNVNLKRHLYSLYRGV